MGPFAVFVTGFIFCLAISSSTQEPLFWRYFVKPDGENYPMYEINEDDMIDIKRSENMHVERKQPSIVPISIALCKPVCHYTGCEVGPEGICVFEGTSEECPFHCERAAHSNVNCTQVSRACVAHLVTKVHHTEYSKDRKVECYVRAY